ncbi:hypothetical protein FB45DRAFT_1064379 [Roridomyces roridus]|uniref:F-box domain-containing protein n=1 Tax=Roridomyces roridus TaxID=1738132 RepID=A0AAD7BB97_9AGAR|nr:hypothetical protein FB45DRAFT_1064379 [Roridomyces roridus]
MASMSAMLRTRLAHNDEQVATLESQVAALESRIALLRRDRQIPHDQLAAIVYPILTLPDDVTSSIFLQYADEYPTRKCSPIVLASVCTQWHAVALTTTGLWTRFSSERFYSSGSQRCVQLPDLLRMWLSRSGALPLDLRIELPWTIRSREAIMGLSLEYSSRWGSVQLGNFSPHELQGGPRAFPFLTDLVLSSKEPGPVASIPSLLDAPRLRSVELSGPTFIDHGSLPSLPWRQLTNLNISVADPGECLQILEQTQMLEVLGFTLTANWDEQVTFPAPRVIILRHVHTLRLSRQTTQFIFRHLTLPALRQLDMKHAMVDSAPEVAALMQRSRCPVMKPALAD